MEDRTQIKFGNPDIDGSTVPSMVVLEQENPIEGTTTNDDGQEYTYHKWLCTNMTYFMASSTLDAMLKTLTSRVGVPIKIEKVVNPRGGHPFFHVNGKSKDDIVGLNVPPTTHHPSEPPLPAQAVTLDGINKKLDEIITLLKPKDGLSAPNTDDLPF